MGKRRRKRKKRRRRRRRKRRRRRRKSRRRRREDNIWGRCIVGETTTHEMMRSACNYSSHPSGL